MTSLSNVSWKTLWIWKRILCDDVHQQIKPHDRHRVTNRRDFHRSFQRHNTSAILTCDVTAFTYIKHHVFCCYVMSWTHSSDWRAQRVCRCLLTAGGSLATADNAERHPKSHLTQHTAATHRTHISRDSHCRTELLWSVCHIFCREFLGKCPFLQTSAGQKSAWRYLKHKSIWFVALASMDPWWRCNIKFTQKPMQESINSFFICGPLPNILQKKRWEQECEWLYQHL